MGLIFSVFWSGLQPGVALDATPLPAPSGLVVCGSPPEVPNIALEVPVDAPPRAFFDAYLGSLMPVILQEGDGVRGNWGTAHSNGCLATGRGGGTVFHIATTAGANSLTYRVVGQPLPIMRGATGVVAALPARGGDGCVARYVGRWDSGFHKGVGRWIVQFLYGGIARTAAKKARRKAD
jgi:hypothetical protein